MPPKERFSWSPLRKWPIGNQYHGDYAFFDSDEGRFETAPVVIAGWFSGDEGDYVREFAECVRFYD